VARTDYTAERLAAVVASAERLAAYADDTPARPNGLYPSLTDAAARVADDAAQFAGGEYRPEYNGWTNRETWNTALWIDNEQAWAETAREIVAAAVAGCDYDTRNHDAMDHAYRVMTAAEALKAWWDDENAPTDDERRNESSGPLADAWSYAVAVTNWREIIETSYADEIRNPETEAE